MSEYTLYIATVLLVIASIVMSRMAFDEPGDRAVNPVTFIQHASKSDNYLE